MNLCDDIATIPGIGPKRAALLANLGVNTLGDMLAHYPRAYEDRRAMTPISGCEPGDRVSIEAEVVSARNVRLRGRMSMAVVKLRDATGEMSATFFGRGFLAQSTFIKGARGFFTGVVETYNGLALKNPDYEMVDEDGRDATLHAGRIVPIYPLCDGLSQRLLRRMIAMALDAVDLNAVQDALTPALRTAHGLPEAREALRAVHFPDSLEQAEEARTRFAFEELLLLQLGVLRERVARLLDEQGVTHTINGPILRGLGAALPFALTGAQERAISAILHDMAAPRPMCRLLQGDVGCGKTIVALHAIAAAVDGGYQAAIMAPTEILAEQHFRQFRALLQPLGVQVELLTSAMRGAKHIRKRLENGFAQVAVGTHALVQEATTFEKLGLVVVDEQHRFGVRQRAVLADKGRYPDVLQMTATPIPRTLAIAIHGGMDISIIDELPPGRLPVKTRQVPAGKTEAMYAYVMEQVLAGAQAYVICPLIEESEKRPLTSLLQRFDELSHGPLAGARTGVLHGRLDASEKDTLMDAFKQGVIQVLFSTTVVEVGVDVPAATIMVIEDAGQFGLTQLHQLRGRVGRGQAQSYCFLAGGATTTEGKQRLEALCSYSSGFDLAEEDLKLRGPGEFFGARQAGITDLRAADLLRDARLLEKARSAAESMLEADPRLDAPEHAALRQTLERRATLRA